MDSSHTPDQSKMGKADHSVLQHVHGTGKIKNISTNKSQNILDISFDISTVKRNDCKILHPYMHNQCDFTDGDTDDNSA